MAWDRRDKDTETDCCPPPAAGDAAACCCLMAFSMPNAKSGLLQQEVELIKFLCNCNKEMACASVSSGDKQVDVTKLKLYPVNLPST